MQVVWRTESTEDLSLAAEGNECDVSGIAGNSTYNSESCVKVVVQILLRPKSLCGTMYYYDSGCVPSLRHW